MRHRHLIVDGYNVIRTDPVYAAIADGDLAGARARLVEDVAAYTGGDPRAVVVFDGAGNAGSGDRVHHIAGVTVIFSAAGEEADAVVEGLARRYASEGGEVTVATSDAQTQWVVMGAGAARVSAAGLVREMTVARAGREDAMPHAPRRGRVEDRIDDVTRDALARWARGL